MAKCRVLEITFHACSANFELNYNGRILIRLHQHMPIKMYPGNMIIDAAKM